MNLEKIVKMSQKSLKNALSKHFVKMGYRGKSAKGFLYFEGNVPVLLVAHLDTVHRQPVRHILYSKDKALMASPEGIGGDDRAGVYAILQIVKQHRCHVLFCEDEETGGIGARQFTRYDISPKVNYIVEVDRRGSNDAVFYGCDNREFTSFVCDFGFEEAFGSFSDISIIAPHLEIAAVNISAGYYNEHTRHEYINLRELENNVQRISRMVSTHTGQFKYIEREYRHSYRWDSFMEPTLWDYMATRSNETMNLMVIPDSAYVSVSGVLDSDTAGYLLDKRGRVYDYLVDHEVAVRSENAQAYSKAGLPLNYDPAKAIRVRVIPMEEALCLMDEV